MFKIFPNNSRFSLTFLFFKQTINFLSCLFISKMEEISYQYPNPTKVSDVELNRAEFWLLETKKKEKSRIRWVSAAFNVKLKTVDQGENY